MSFFKAKQAFQENGKRYLTTKDGHLWNTNAGLLNLCEAMDDEFSALKKKIRSLEQQLHALERAARK